MKTYKEEQPSNLEGALKVFERGLQEQSWKIQGIPGFIPMTHRDECALCEQYAAHVIEAAKCLIVAIPSHRIEVAFQTAWPQTVTDIKDEAVDKAVRDYTYTQSDYWSQ